MPDTTPPPTCNADALFGLYALYWRIEENLDDINISPPLSRVERHLMVALRTPKRMGDLARELHALPSTVTAAADQLEQRGLAVRERDPTDRRAWLLGLTPQAMEIRSDLLARVSDLFATASGLDPADYDTLALLLRKVRAHIKETGLPEGLKK